MLDFDTSIHMLEIVHCSGRDRAQYLGFYLIKSKLRGVMSYS